MLYAKKYILVLLVSAFALTLNAQSRSSQKPHSYIYLSLGAGEANTLAKPIDNYEIKNKIGYNGLFGFGYEMAVRKFFFTLGVDATYSHYGQTLAEFTDSRIALDLENDRHEYQYLYSNYAEQQNMLHIGVPVMFGGLIGDYMYFGVGGKFAFGILSNYNSTAEMFTQGIYEQYPEPLKSDLTPEAVRWGFYPLADYDYKSEGRATIETSRMRVAALLEIGAQIPLKNKKNKMRIGLYAEYGLPIGASNNHTKLHLTDYSKVDIKPQTQSQQNLMDKLKYNSILDSDFLQSAYQNISVGVKMTVAFDVTIDNAPCNCLGGTSYSFF